jgi:hypothetical protein
MDSSDEVIRFANTAIVLKQPLLVFITIAFIVALLATQYSPESTSSPASIWVWLLRLTALAVCALGVWMLCHSEEIVVDGTQRRVTQSHRFLNYEVTKNQFSFSDFSGVCVELKIDSEHRATTTPGGGFTKTSTQSVNTRSYSLNLRRPDLVLKTPDRQISAPSHPLELPVADGSNPLVVEAVARTLARLGGWPAWRHHYTLLPDSAPAHAGKAYGIKIVPDVDDPIHPE